MRNSLDNSSTPHYDNIIMNAHSALTAARRDEVAAKLNIAPAALWAWTDEDLLKAEANGTTQTDAGVVINAEGAL